MNKAMDWDSWSPGPLTSLPLTWQVSLSKPFDFWVQMDPVAHHPDAMQLLEHWKLTVLSWKPHWILSWLKYACSSKLHLMTGWSLQEYKDLAPLTNLEKFCRAIPASGFSVRLAMPSLGLHGFLTPPSAQFSFFYFPAGVDPDSHLNKILTCKFPQAYQRLKVYHPPGTLVLSFSIHPISGLC